MANIGNEAYEISTSEYDAAGQRFFSVGIKALMDAQGGVYSLVSKESMEQLPDYSVPLPDDDAVRGRPIDATAVVVIRDEDVITGDVDSVLAAMDSVATEMTGQITKGILDHISEICGSTGNVVAGELSYDVINDVMEKLDFSFDDEGNHNVSVVVDPQGAQRLQDLGKPTAEQQARYDEIIARKKADWNARRGSRSLPSRRI
jgi:hypothetical protein